MNPSLGKLISSFPDWCTRSDAFEATGSFRSLYFGLNDRKGMSSPRSRSNWCITARLPATRFAWFHNSRSAFVGSVAKRLFVLRYSSGLRNSMFVSCDRVVIHSVLEGQDA